MRNKMLPRILLAVLPLLLTACQILPAEEQLPAAPIIQNYELPEYEKTLVKRGDVVRTENILCTYEATKTEEHSFSVDGAYFEAVYVSEGQQVRAGDLLAELVQDDVEAQIEALEYELSVLKLRKSHIYENWELEKRLLEAKQASQEKKNAADQKYELQLQSIADSQYIKNLRLQALKEQRSSRQLLAGIDGIVTFALDVQPGDRTVEYQTVVAIADMQTTAFTAYGDYEAYFPIGAEVTIWRSGNALEAVVIDGSQLGLADNLDGKAAFYFQLLLPDPSLEDGAIGTITITAEASYDVLYLEKKAIQTNEDKTFVYVQDENGFKVKKTVTTGVSDGTYVEIVSGLEEGDSVIIE